jgi:2-methylisocitrate lyase-like PEP mutase family enzyme
MVLSYVVRRLGSDPVGILMARRSEVAGERDPNIERLLADRSGERLAPDPLGIAAIGALLRAETGVSHTRPMLQRIHATSGGNPLFALELGRVIGDGPERLEIGSDLPLPDALLSLMGARVAHLPRATRDILAIALEHLRVVAGSVEVPVNADFEGGFAVEPERVAANVARAAETGVAGLSIEDSSGDSAEPLFDFDLSVARIGAARKAIDDDGGRVLLTARSEGFVVGRPDLSETIRRLQAYSDAGADCLYAPGIRTPDEITVVVGAVAPKPVNVLVGSDFTTVAALADLGVRRISVGGALARVALGAFLQIATEIAEQGTFSGFGPDIPFAEIDQAFSAEGEGETRR